MKPIINDIPAFDKNVGTTGTFITKGQIYSHTVIIKDINAEKIIYQEASQPNSRINRFTIPAYGNNLVNGCYYLLYIRIFENENDIKYYESDPKIIKCVSTPSFQLNIYSGEHTHYILKSTSLNVGVNYIQQEQEFLNEFYVIVKDSEDKEIYKSELIYNVNENIEINGLENHNTYTVCAYGKTINGMEITTEKVTVDVDYISCNDSSVLTAENDKKNACVILKSHIDGIVYKLNKPPVYNPSLDLTDNTLEYCDGLDINGDFSIFIKYRPTSLNNTVLNINNGEIKLNFKVKG